MNANTSIEMYNILKERLGEEEAKALTEYIEDLLNKAFKKQSSVLATKEDLAKLKAEISKEMSEITKEISEGKLSTSKEIGAVKEEVSKRISKIEVDLANTKTELTKAIADAKAEMIKWMFIFWIGQILVVVSILVVIFKELIFRDQ